MNYDCAPVPGVLQIPAPDRTGYPLDVVLVEQRDAAGAWHLAGVGIRDEAGSAWLPDADPGGSFDYWWEKDSNGYTYAVFHYAAATPNAAIDLAHLRRAELAAGAAPTHFAAVTTSGQPAQADVDRGSENRAFDDAAGYDEPEPEAAQWSHPIAVALTWRLAAELVRRHPDRLWVAAEGGGLYDRVTVLDTRVNSNDNVVVIFNAAGSHALVGADGTQMQWVDAFVDDGDPARWLRRLEKRCALPKPPSPLPRSTPRSLAVRCIAAFLAVQVGAVRPWLPRPLVGWEPDGWHQDLATQLRRGTPSGPPEVVFIGRAGDTQPQFALTDTGRLVRRDGTSFDLASLHRPRAAATALLVATVGDLLP